MDIKRFIFGDKATQGTKKPKNLLQNPYVLGAEGRKEWNDRYMNMAKSIRNWQLAFGSAMLIILVESLVIAKIASQSRVQPFVVETNQGMPVAIRPVEGVSPSDQKIINFAVNQFVVNAKTVMNDAQAQEQALDKVYAYSAENTIPFLSAYYAKNDPYQLAAQGTVSVEIINSMPISKNAWQVTWDETKRNPSGQVIGVSRWMGQLTYKIGEVQEKYINNNPFGVYITNVTWSQSHQG